MFWKVSRFSKIHNFLRVTYNKIFWQLPDGFKYGLGKLIRMKRLPYRLINDGSVVIQIGCPWDLLRAGRSRGVYFSLFAGRKGTVVIVEPDADSLKALKEFIVKQRRRNVVVIDKGAWSEKRTLHFLYDPKHPASNLIEDVYDNSRTDKAKYRTIKIEVDTLDNLMASLNLEKVDLISITTNGAESEILQGMPHTLGKTQYISLIKSIAHFPNLSASDFRIVGSDDRGFTYIREKA